MTEQELRQIEAAIRNTVTDTLQRGRLIATIRTATASLITPPERPSERMAREREAADALMRDGCTGSGANRPQKQMHPRCRAEISGSDHSVPNCRRSSTLRTQSAQSELSFANAMHQLDTGDRDRGVSKVLEAQHHSDPLLHTSVVLLDQVVQVLRRP
jgi:hypothetical protein